MRKPPGTLWIATAIAGLAACSRDPVPAPCPDLAPGDLVVSEVRGPQAGDADEAGEWIEIYNASGATVDLAGTRVVVAKLDGSAAGEFLIRSHETEVEADGFAVAGRFFAGFEPAHIDYGYADDFDDELFSSAAIDLYACDTRVDRVIYRDLTDFGSLALDGAIDPPSADANDDETAFCVDDALDDANPSAGAAGSPGARNPPCD